MAADIILLPRGAPYAEVVSDEDIVTFLREGVSAAGSQRAYARMFRLHESDLSATLSGGQRPTEAQARAVGVVWARMRDTARG